MPSWSSTLIHKDEITTDSKTVCTAIHLINLRILFWLAAFCDTCDAFDKRNIATIDVSRKKTTNNVLKTDMTIFISYMVLKYSASASMEKRSPADSKAKMTLNSITIMRMKYAAARQTQNKSMMMLPFVDLAKEKRTDTQMKVT